MKKFIENLVCGVIACAAFIMVIGCIYYHVNTCDNYEQRIAELNSKNKELNSEIEELNSEIEAKDSNVYNMFNHKDYAITITHNGKKLTYVGEDTDKLFGKKTYVFTNN